MALLPVLRLRVYRLQRSLSALTALNDETNFRLELADARLGGVQAAGQPLAVFEGI